MRGLFDDVRAWALTSSLSQPCRTFIALGHSQMATNNVVVQLSALMMRIKMVDLMFTLANLVTGGLNALGLVSHSERSER